MSDDINIQNEEDVKNKIIIPYLQELGFIKEELDFEINFNVKIGKTTHTIVSKKSMDSVNARLDILVKYQGKNICIFEVKRDTLEISNEDIAQAVSYGSLIKPQVPFCIVTNGKNSILVDTVSCKEFQKEEIERYKVNGYEITLPDELYYERIKHFIGYSKDNLIKFCKEQVALYMKPLKGSQIERHKKYIREIYEPSEMVTESLNKFINNDVFSSFVLVAKSGMGKTCWSCHVAETFLEKGFPTLFYRAGDIRKGIFEAITDDLNWTLAPQFDVAQGIKRFLDIFQNDTVFIVVDGLDEIELNLARDLTESFLRRIEDKKIKFIGTCKANIWESLLTKDEIPSQLQEKTWEHGFILDKLEETQFCSIIEKYSQFYNYEGLFESEVLKDCKRDPYLLRVMFEVASSEQIKHLTYTCVDFFTKYYERIIKRFDVGERDQIRTILNKIGELLYEKNSDYADINEIKSHLQLRSMDSLPLNLFSFSILDKQEEEHSEKIGFYFQRFRDYIIAFRVFQWQQLTPKLFGEQHQNSILSGVRLNVLELYYTLASEEHKRVLDESLYGKAYRYVSFYESILDNHFNLIKEIFKPNTKGEIGFVGYADISGSIEMQMHGFRRINDSDTKVLLIPASKKIQQLLDDNSPHLYGVETGMHIRFPSVFTDTINIEESVIVSEILPELKKIIENGRLNETNSIILLCEKLFAIGHSIYSEYIGVNPRFSGIEIKSFPLSKLKEGVLTRRAFRILKDKLIKEKLNSGEISVIRQGTTISYVESLSQRERDLLWKEANEKGCAEIFLPTEICYAENNFEEDILNAISIFEKENIREIYDPLITRRNALSKFNELCWGYKVDIEYAEVLFRELLEMGLKEYRNLVENNFLSFKEAFKTYSEIPLTYFISIKEYRYHNSTRLEYIKVVCKPLINGNYDYRVKIQQDLDFWECRCGEKKIIAGEEYEIVRAEKGDFRNFLIPSTSLTNNKSYLYCIRNLAYSLVKKEINKFFSLMAKSYGVELKKGISFN